MEISKDDAFYIAAWLVEPPLNRISREGKVRQLDPRTMQVLICLAARPGEVVKREELMDRVWGEVIVNENTLSSVVARLRKTLGDDWQNPQYIETVSKSGYRLIAPVHAGDVAVSLLHGDRLPLMTVSRSAERLGGSEHLGGQRTASWLIPTVVGGLVLMAVLLGGLWWWHPFFASVQRPLDPQPLLTLPGTEVGATLSPDGQQVAFMWQGPNQDNWDVYVTLIGEGNPVRVTTDSLPEGLPAWSPDGQYLAFARGDRVAMTCDIYRIPVIGGQELRLGECGQGINSMAWSSDGKHLVMSAVVSEQAPSVLMLFDIEKQEQRALTHSAEGSRGDRDPVFSPDNKKVAFRRRRKAGGYDLFVVPVTSGAPQQLTFDKQGSVGGVDWTPEGKHLVYSSNRDGEYRLWRLPVAGGEPTRVALNDYGLTSLRHARHANRLVYRTMRDETDLWAIQMDEDRAVQGPPTKLLSSTREELFPQFSPTGERIAFTSKRTGFYEIWTGRRDGAALIRHTDFQGALVGAPRWSPEGQLLVFDASPEGQADLYLVDADSQFPRRLTTDASDEVNGRFSRDGQWIYYSSNRSGQWEIWKTNVAGKEAGQITRTSGVEAQESLDGQDLYFTRADTLGLWKIPAQGGEEALVISDFSPPDWGNWVVGAEGIYFVQQSTKAIAFYHFTSGAITALYTPTKTISFIGPALTVSPEERLILFGQIERSEDEIMLVDF